MSRHRIKKNVWIAFLIYMCFAVNIPIVNAARETTPLQNTFSLNNSFERFILLDSTDEGFYIMTQSYYGTRAFDPNDTAKFDIKDSNNIAYWLNGEFLAKGNGGKKLPSEIQKHIIEREWDIEAGHPNVENSEAFSTTAKVAFLSRAEYEKYCEIFGYADERVIGETSIVGWYLRSPDPATVGNGKGVVALSMLSTGKIGNFKNTRGNAVRPVFYLDKDFFKKVKLNTDLYYLGDNIKIAIRKNYTKKELESIYSSEELEIIFDEPLKPVATVKGLKNYPGVGCEVEALYDFYSPSEKKDGGSVVRWYKSKTLDGNYELIAEGSRYLFKSEDANCYIKVDVVPIDEDRTMGFASDRFQMPCIVQDDYKPIASNVYLIGANSVGTRLVLNYNYSDENLDKERDSQYVWERSKDGKVFEVIEGFNTKNYILSKDDVGYMVRCGVTVNNATSMGVKVYTPLTEIVFEKPVAENVKVVVNGDYAELGYNYKGNAQENATLMWWEVSEKANEGYMYLAASEKEKIEIKDLRGMYLRCAVAAKDIDGHIGETVYSEPVKLEGVMNKPEFNSSKDIYRVCGSAEIYSSGRIAPKMLSMDVVGENPDDIKIFSQMYDVFISRTQNGIHCTLLLKNGDFATGEVKIADIKGIRLQIKNIMAGVYSAGGYDEVGLYTPRIERF